MIVRQAKHVSSLQAHHVVRVRSSRSRYPHSRRANKLLTQQLNLHPTTTQQVRTLEAILTSINEGVLVVSPEGELLLANPVAEQMLSGGRTPLLADLPLDRVLEGMPLHEVLLARDLIAGGEQLLSASATPLRTDDANNRAVVVVLRDITASARTQVRMAAAEQQARLLAAAGARLDASLVLSEVVQAGVELAAELLGFSFTWMALSNGSDESLDVVGSHGAYLPLPGQPHQSLPTSISLAHTSTGTCFYEGRTLVLDDEQMRDFYDTPLLHPQTESDRQSTVAVLLPLRLDGRIVGVLGLSSTAVQHHLTQADIALAEALASRVATAVENARLHSATKALQAFYRGVTNTAGVLLFTLDRELRLTWANSEWDAFAHHLDIPELLWSAAQGTSIVPILPRRRQAELLSAARRLLAGAALEQGGYVYQTEIVRRIDDLDLALLISFSPRPNEHGQIEGLTVSVTNITHIRRLEAELQARHDELQRTQVQLVAAARLAAAGELIAGVAHELNNPLTGVLGWAEMMLEDGEADLDGVRRIYQGALRARRIVQGLLTFARQSPPERGWTEIDELIDTVLALKAADLRLKNVRVRVDLAADLPQVWADPGQLQQVLLNLLANAEHTLQPHGGTLDIVAARHDSTICISITDSGAGIPKDVLPRIFEPFFTTKAIGQGTGLGLAISHGIVQSHGGSISAENVPGGGARFKIVLPAGASNQAASPQAAPTPPTDAGLRQPFAARRLLVIDDEPGIRSLLQLQLGVRGYQVTAAYDGPTALALVERETFDALICDLRMPGMDGEEFYRALTRRHPQLAQQIVFITGDTASADANAFLAEIGGTLLTKPFLAGELIEVLVRLEARVSEH